MHRLPILLTAVAVLASGCAAAPSASPTPAADAPTAASGQADLAQDAGQVEPGAGLNAVATLFPLAWMASQIAPAAQLSFLGARGQDPHDLELSPQDRLELQRADVVVFMGALQFQPQVEEAVADASGQVVDVRAVAGDETLLAFDHSAHDDEHADDEGHAHDEDEEHAHDEDEEHGHDEDADEDHDEGDEHDGDERGAVDPHLWFDAGVMAEVALQLGEVFAAADPAQAAAFRQRAQAVHDTLVTLDEDIGELLSDCALDVAIVSHEAYAYLLAPHGLRQEGISGAGGHGEASPQRLAELAAFIGEHEVPAVLAEPFEGRSDAEALAREAGVALLEIDPLEVVDEAAFARGYPQLLREQAEAFAEALACG